MPETIATTRDINKALRQRLAKSSIIKIGGLAGQHSIAVGLSKDAKITIEGEAGDFFGAFNDGTSLVVKGPAGNYPGDCMLSGLIHIQGDAGAGVGVYMKGGTIVVKGSTMGQVGQMSSGGTILVDGDVGIECGSRLMAGDIFITGDTADHVGDGMVGGSIYVGGKLGRLGKNAQVQKLDREDKKKIVDVLTKYGFKGEFKFKKVVAKDPTPYSSPEEAA